MLEEKLVFLQVLLHVFLKEVQTALQLIFNILIVIKIQLN